MKTPTYLTRHLSRFFLPVASNTRSNSIKKYYTLCNYIKRKRKRKNNLWVAATHTRNYMINDPIVDWLRITKWKNNKNNHKNHANFPMFNKFIMDKGIKFEDKIIKFINDNIHPVVTVVESTKNACTGINFNKTVKYMKAGVPILHSAPVRTKNNTGGVIDLLVRSDYVNKLVNVNALSEAETKIHAPRLSGDFHYVVIDIKFSTLPLRADGIHILNSDNYPAYKTQIYIYTQAVGEIQGYESSYGFIMGRRWKYISKDIKYNEYSCLDKLGVINYETIDKDYKEKTQKAIQWVRDVKTNGLKWQINPPSRKELYPNMSVDSGIWNNEKRKIAKNLGEITQLWYCGVKHRNIAINNGINNWKNPNCNSSSLGQKGSRSLIIDKIIKINQQNVDKIRPAVITSNMHNWKHKQDVELFIDFETISDIFSDFSTLPAQASTEMIFMIGVSWKENDKFVYRSFICNDSTLSEEYRIMNEFVEFVENKGDPPLYFWHAEKSFWERAEHRQFNREELTVEQSGLISGSWCIKNWKDLTQLFRAEPIVLKGCFGFGLKDIARAMRQYGMIQTRIESNCHSGMDAMIYAWDCYKNNDEPATCNIMKDIRQYNKFDCEVLGEILEYLRDNHTG